MKPLRGILSAGVLGLVLTGCGNEEVPYFPYDTIMRFESIIQGEDYKDVTKPWQIEISPDRRYYRKGNVFVTIDRHVDNDRAFWVSYITSTRDNVNHVGGRFDAKSGNPLDEEAEEIQSMFGFK